VTKSQVEEIIINRQPSQEQLAHLGIWNWPIWTQEVSEFPWTYDVTETCYLLEGEVTVTPDGGLPVKVAKGDLVTFPAGMSCIWKIHHPVRKHYQFG
jgi:uncharacterized cupin superfamily protein